MATSTIILIIAVVILFVWTLINSARISEVNEKYDGLRSTVYDHRDRFQNLIADRVTVSSFESLKGNIDKLSDYVGEYMSDTESRLKDELSLTREALTKLAKKSGYEISVVHQKDRVVEIESIESQDDGEDS